MVYTGSLVVRVSSVERASAAARRVATDQRGFVFAETTDQGETNLTVKVPSDRFDSTVTAMAKLGKVLRRSVNAQDVTADVVDVEGRLKTAQTSANRLRTLLTEAKTSADVVAVEGELAKRETDIETLQGRLRVLNDQVALATVSVRFTERNSLKVNDDLPGFLGGLRAGIVAFVNVGQAAAVALGFLLPFLPVLAFLIWAWRRYRRRHPRAPRRPSMVTFGPPPQPAGAPSGSTAGSTPQPPVPPAG